MSMSVMINAGDPPLRRFRWTAAAARWADEVGPVVRAGLKATAPVGKGQRAGRLRDSIRYQRATQVGRSVRAEFTANTPYARYVVSGTRPHRITAKAARALRFEQGGAVRFARSVWHPGTKPNDFAAFTMRNMLPMVQARYTAIMREELTGL